MEMSIEFIYYQSIFGLGGEPQPPPPPVLQLPRKRFLATSSSTPIPMIGPPGNFPGYR